MMREAQNSVTVSVPYGRAKRLSSSVRFALAFRRRGRILQVHAFLSTGSASSELLSSKHNSRSSTRDAPVVSTYDAELPLTSAS